MIKKVLVSIIALLAALVLLYKGKELLKSREQEIAKEPTPSAREVYITLVQAKHGVMQNKREFLATVESLKNVKISTKLAGYIKNVYVSEADEVKKGDTLVKIDEVELLSNINSLKASLLALKTDAKIAKRIYKRNLKLYNTGGLPKEKLELSKVAMVSKASLVENTKQKIIQLEHQRKYLTIVAPFDAKVDTIFMHKGDLAVTGKPILSLSSKEKKLIFTFASGTSPIKINQKVFIRSKLVGYIKSIYPMATNGLTTVEVALEENLSQPIGSSVEIEVLLGTDKGCIVPIQTLLHKKDGVFVMLYKDKRFTSKRVDILTKYKDKALIKECPSYPLAKASEVKLASLPAIDRVNILGVSGE